jgi:hypothetical protein
MKMSTRTYTTKSGNTFEWEETQEVVTAVQKLTKFSGNYKGPLYAPHPDLKNGKETN